MGQYIENEINEIPNKDDIIREIQEPLEFLCVIAATTTVYSGVRTESAEINVPIELKGKKFKITNIAITAISSTAAAFAAGDNLLVGLILNGKPLLQGASQSINGATITLDMLPVPLMEYIDATNIASRQAQYKLLSELFVNITKLKILYSHKSTSAVHYLIYLTFGGLIL